MWKRQFKNKTQGTANKSTNPCVLTLGTQFDGIIQSNESIRIDGEVRGEVYCSNRLVVGERGKVVGRIYCHTLDNSGEIVGDIACVGVVSLHAESKVRGDIRCGGLQADSLVDLQGICETKIDGRMLSAKIESFHVTENPPLVEPANQAIFNQEVNVEEEWEKLLKEKKLN